MSRKFIIPNRSTGYFSMPASFFVQDRERACEGGWREVRRDSMVCRFFSFVINRVTSRAVGVE
jgi:hypothetical protein